MKLKFNDILSFIVSLISDQLWSCFAFLYSNSCVVIFFLIFCNRFANNAIFTHDYSVTVDGTIHTITVTAEDWLGQKSAAFSRRVTLKSGYESNLDEI